MLWKANAASEFDIRINPHFVLKRAHPKVKELRARAKAQHEVKAATEAKKSHYKGDLFTVHTKDESFARFADESPEEFAARKAANKRLLEEQFPNGVAAIFDNAKGAQPAHAR